MFQVMRLVLCEGGRSFRGKPPQREICIICEYQIQEDKAACQLTRMY
jgi:hypothetical protein